MMSDDAEVQRKQLEGMTIEQLVARIQQNQYENKKFIEQLVIHATVQDYTEQQYNELLILLQEALTFLEELSSLPLEWVERRNELLVKLRKKL